VLQINTHIATTQLWDFTENNILMEELKLAIKDTTGKGAGHAW
jgi:hypothetical protein